MRGEMILSIRQITKVELTTDVLLFGTEAVSRLPNGQMKNNSSVVLLRFRGAKKVNKCCMFCILLSIFLVLVRESKIGECHATSYGSLRLWCKQEVREVSPFVRFTFCARKVYQKQIKTCRNSCCLGCVLNFMTCSKVIYTGLIKTEIGNWNSDGYFHRACAICEKSWWKILEKSG